LVVASDSPNRNAKATPDPARAAMSTAPVGAAAASKPNPMAPSKPPVNMRFMPYRSPSAPAPSTAAASVRVARLATKLAVLGDMSSPTRTSEMLADKIVGSAAVML
jgi:hypothetical protein